MNIAAGTDDFLEKLFTVTGVSRADIKRLGASDEEVALLTDEDMEAIASRMGDIYVGGGDYWLDLGFAVNWRLKGKGLEKLELSDVPDEEV